MIEKAVKYFVYIVECNDGTFYTGYTNNLERRLKEHHNSRGAKYLRGKGPVKLVWVKEYKYFKNVLRAEKSVKKLRRLQKEAIIKAYEKQKKDRF